MQYRLCLNWILLQSSKFNKNSLFEVTDKNSYQAKGPFEVIHFKIIISVAKICLSSIYATKHLLLADAEISSFFAQTEKKLFSSKVNKNFGEEIAVKKCSCSRWVRSRGNIWRQKQFRDNFLKLCVKTEAEKTESK